MINLFNPSLTLRVSIYNTLLQLRDMVPARRPEKKMSKLQILKSATKYINFLTQVLHRDEEVNSQVIVARYLTGVLQMYAQSNVFQ